MALSVVVLAAGKGTRMQSALPKVLQPLAGQPLLSHVLVAAAGTEPAQTAVVIGHGADQIQAAFQEQNIEWVEQTEQLGTGHAVQQALPVLPDEGTAVILYGDVPLVRAETIKQLSAAADSGLALLTVQLDDPTGYGRIVRQNGSVQAIVEQKDASPTELEITEVNTGLMAAPVAKLRSWLPKLTNNNAQGEYYLTDIVAMAVADGVEVQAVVAAEPDEVAGVNDRVQLAEAEVALRRQRVTALQRQGVTVVDPLRIDIRGNLQCGRDVVLDVNTVFEGRVVLADNVTVGVGSILKNCDVAAGTNIAPYSVIDDAIVGENCTIGPFARLRPGAALADEVHIGNYVEVKKSSIGHGSKANHLTYVGDAIVGAGVNIGAGTITCNYDGANKHQTVIEDNVFIGSGTELVAPITIGKGATTGAGTTLSKSVPADALAVARAKARTIANWARPVKKIKD